MRHRVWLHRALAMSFGLLLSEVLLSAAGAVSPRLWWYLTPPWERATLADPVLGYRLSPYFPGHDTRGYRNESASTHSEGLAIGDSVTYGHGAIASKSWPRQLEALSGRSIYNAGVGGYGPCEYKQVLNELLVLRPRIVVVGLYLGNDIANAFTSVYYDDRFNDLRNKDNSVLRDIREADQIATLREKAARLGDLSGLEISHRRERLLQRSSLFRLARGLYYSIFVAPELWSPFRHDYVYESFEVAARRPFRVAFPGAPNCRTVFRSPELDGLAVNLDDPRILEGMRITQIVLSRVQTDLDNTKIHLLVALLRNKPTNYLQFVERSATHGLPQSFFHLVDMEERVAQVMSEFFVKSGIEYVDTKQAVRRSLDLGECPYHESDDHHPNEIGYQAIAEAILPTLNSVYQ